MTRACLPESRSPQPCLPGEETTGADPGRERGRGITACPCGRRRAARRRRGGAFPAVRVSREARRSTSCRQASEVRAPSRPAGRAASCDSIGVRVGVFLLAARFPGQSEDEVLAATVQAAVAAERAGFDDVWLAEHHFMSYGICPSAVTLAGYVLGRTGRVDVGTAVSVLSAWHPVALAEQAALLDQVLGRPVPAGRRARRPVAGTRGPRHRAGPVRARVRRGPGPAAGRAVPRPGWRGGRVLRFREVPAAPSAPNAPAPAGRGGGHHAGHGGSRPRPGGCRCCWGCTPMTRGKREHDGPLRGGRGAVRRTAAGGRARGGGRRAGSRHPRGGPRACCARGLPRWLGPGLAGYVPVDGRARPARDPDAYAEWLCRCSTRSAPPPTAPVPMAETVRRTGIGHLICMVEGSGRPGCDPGEHRPARRRGPAPPARAGRHRSGPGHRHGSPSRGRVTLRTWPPSPSGAHRAGRDLNRSRSSNGPVNRPRRQRVRGLPVPARPDALAWAARMRRSARPCAR